MILKWNQFPIQSVSEFVIGNVGDNTFNNNFNRAFGRKYVIIKRLESDKDFLDKLDVSNAECVDIYVAVNRRFRCYFGGFKVT